MLGTLHDEAIVPFKYVVADCLYGNSAGFLDAVDRYVDLVYLVAIPADTRAWLQGPVMETKLYRYLNALQSLSASADEFAPVAPGLPLDVSEEERR